jgi:hypothetical protein
MSEWRATGCDHDWQEMPRMRSWLDDRGIRHSELKCKKCDQMVALVSAVDVHEWQATASQESADEVSR